MPCRVRTCFKAGATPKPTASRQQVLGNGNARSAMYGANLGAVEQGERQPLWKPVLGGASLWGTATASPLGGSQFSSLNPEEKKTIGVFENVRNSVVFITTYLSREDVQEMKQQMMMQQMYGLDGGSDEGVQESASYGFDDGMGMSQFTKTPADGIKAGQGSGFVWDNKGHIVTNAHVVEGARSLKVTLPDESEYDAKVIGSDVSKDLALIQVTSPEALKKLTSSALGTSADLKVGQTVLAIGCPFGLDHTLTQGIVSAKDRTIGAKNGRPISGVIQTDASINPGNSGGPLLNSSGEVIGINSQIMDPTGQGASAGIGFAIPVDVVKKIVASLMKYGRVKRVAFGISLASAETLKSIEGMRDQEGVLVLEVSGPAEKAGMQGSEFEQTYEGTFLRKLGDIIIAINGKPVKDDEDLFNITETLHAGSTNKVKVLRNGQEVELSVTVTESPADEGA